MRTLNTPEQSGREQYYAELETLEPDPRLREAIQAARKSETQQKLVQTWLIRNASRHRSA
jgi:hypothetical protein